MTFGKCAALSGHSWRSQIKVFGTDPGRIFAVSRPELTPLSRDGDLSSRCGKIKAWKVSMFWLKMHTGLNAECLYLPHIRPLLLNIIIRRPFANRWLQFGFKLWLLGTEAPCFISGVCKQRVLATWKKRSENNP